MVHLQKSLMSLGMQHNMQFGKLEHFCILKKLNDKAYIIDLLEGLQIPPTSNVVYIFDYYPPNAAMVKIIENSKLNFSI